MAIDFSAEFEKLKIEYLESLEDQVNGLNCFIDKKELSTEDVKEIFRIVHSVKGGSSSHELPIIAKICHQFEDFIGNKLVLDHTNSDNRETVLRYIDMLADAVDDYRANDESRLTKYKDLLIDIKIGKIDTAESYSGRVLIADGTNIMGNILQKGLTKLGYECALTKDGLEAFNFLVKEKFDVLICSMSLDQLDGVSLITALKATNNQNSNISTIIISASTNIKDRFPKEYRPNHIVAKNTDIIGELDTVLKEIFGSANHGENAHLNGPKKILYVEDDPRMQKLFALSTKNLEGVEIEFASNKEDAVLKCKSFSPDVLLLDNFLKGCTGQEVFLEVIDLNIPSIFLTASEGAIDAKSLEKHKEFLGIITKPFRPAAIYGQICRFYSSR